MVDLCGTVVRKVLLRYTCCWHQQLLLSIEHSIAVSKLASYRQPWLLARRLQLANVNFHHAALARRCFLTVTLSYLPTMMPSWPMVLAAW